MGGVDEPARETVEELTAAGVEVPRDTLSSTLGSRTRNP